MKKLGTVKNVIHDGTILLSTAGTSGQEIPAPGSRVYDSRGAEIGRVARVFGPVKEPYVSLKPKSQVETVGLLGTSLYLGTEEQMKQDRQRAVRHSSPPNRRFGPPSRPGQRPRQGAGRAPPRKRDGAKRSTGQGKKKGVNQWQRKEKPRKR